MESISFVSKAARWSPPIPTFIPDRLYRRLLRWGVPDRLLSETIDECCASLSVLWKLSAHDRNLSLFFRNRSLVEHGMSTALLALLFSKAEPPRRDLLASAAILHDLGLALIPEEWAFRDPASLSKEALVLSQYHDELGAEMVSRLERFHPDLSVLIRYHHGEPPSLTMKPLAKIIRIADSIDDILRISDIPTDNQLARFIKEATKSISPLDARAIEFLFPRLAATFSV